MTDSMVTYQSRNSKPEHAWLGYIHTEAGRLNMAFFGSTEDGVKAEMKIFWAKDKAIREENRKKRAEAAETRAAKKQSEAA